MSITSINNVEREEPTADESQDLDRRRKSVVSREAFKAFIDKLSSKAPTGAKTQSAANK